MNSIRYSVVKFNPLFSACLIIGLLCLSSTLLAQEPWTQMADMPTARLGFGTAVVNGKIYVIGGQQNETVPLAVVEVYDPDTDSWDTTKTAMPKAKGGFGCAVVEGKIYVIGGGIVGIEKLSDVWMYDPETDSWDTTLTDMNIARSALAADTVNGKIYAIGGADTVGVPILWGISTVEEYDPVTDEWTFKMDKPTAGWALHACTLVDKIYVTGGNVKWPDISAALEVYDPATDSWDTTKAPMPEEKYSHSTCVVYGKIYAFGGWNNSASGPMYADVDVYYPELDLWTERTAMPFELAGFGIAVVNNKVYIIGGTKTLHPFTSSNSVYEYDPASDPASAIQYDDLRIPKEFTLHQNHPNPFNPTTVISWQLAVGSNVELSIYNILGQKIETLINKPMPAGYHEVEFNGQNLSSGIYLYRIEAGKWQDVKKMILLH